PDTVPPRTARQHPRESPCPPSARAASAAGSPGTAGLPFGGVRAAEAHSTTRRQMKTRRAAAAPALPPPGRPPLGARRPWWAWGAPRPPGAVRYPAPVRERPRLEPVTYPERATRRLRLPADDRSPATARAAVRTVLTEAGLTEPLDETLLLTTELATNGVVHDGTGLNLLV